MSKTYNSEYQWFRDVIGVAQGQSPPGQTIHWYFSAQKDGRVLLYIGLDDGLYLSWYLDQDSWSAFVKAGNTMMERFPDE